MLTVYRRRKYEQARQRTLIIGGALFLCLLLPSTTAVWAQDYSKAVTIRTFRDCPNCPEMVALPAGSFLMGESEDEAVKTGTPKYARQMLLPQHRVAVNSFAIGKFTVTRGEFAVFVRETGYNSHGCKTYDERGFLSASGSSWRNPGFRQTDRDPVVCVSWDDAQRYVGWLNAKLTAQNPKSKASVSAYRLPSEAEWEYAARAGTTTSRFWGDDPIMQCNFANAADLTGREIYPHWDTVTIANCRDGYVTTAPVGSFHPNPWGLYDMLGNVNQWIEDCGHFDYSGAPSDGKAWISGECAKHEIRGGGWTSILQGVTSSSRGVQPSSRQDSVTGFRVAKDLPQ